MGVQEEKSLEKKNTPKSRNNNVIFVFHPHFIFFVDVYELIQRKSHIWLQLQDTAFFMLSIE